MGNFKQTVSTLGDKIKGGCRYVRTYWNKAPKNRYLSFKEAAAYCIGGIGINAATMVPMFFWDMTEKKHREIMEVLKVRASVSDGVIDASTGEELEAKLLGGEEDAWRVYMEEHGIEDAIKSAESEDGSHTDSGDVGTDMR